MTRPAGAHAPTSLPGVLADPRVRLCAGVATLLATASAARRDRVDPRETGAFRAVNGLPDSWHLPAWAVMQLGAFGAIPASAAAAWLAGDGELAGRLLASGASTWGLAKLVKQIVRRPRPVALLSGTRRRGRGSPPRPGWPRPCAERRPPGRADPRLCWRPSAARHRGRRRAGTRR